MSQEAPISVDLAQPLPAALLPDIRTAAVRLARPPRFEARLHAGLDRVAGIWRHFETAGASTVYQSAHWARSAAQHLASPAGASPFLVEVRDADTRRPLMLLPLVLRRSSGWRIVEGLDFGVCDYAAPLMAPGLDLAPEDMDGLWKAVLSVLPPADVLRISRLPERIRGVRNPMTLLPECRRMDMQSYGLPIDGDPETLLSRVCAPSMAKDLACKMRRLHKQGTVRFVQATTPDMVQTLFAALLEQRLKRFREAGRFDLLTRPGVPEFYLDAALGSLRGGGPVRLFGISVDGEWVACAYGLVGAGAFHGIILSMADGEWRRCSPGLCMVGEVMKWACAQGLPYFDMTIGALQYKSGFSASGHDLYEVTRALTPVGAVLMRAGRLKAEANAWIRRHPRLFARLRAIVQTARRVEAGIARFVWKETAEGSGAGGSNRSQGHATP